jgi:hypothetical protein
MKANEINLPSFDGDSLSVSLIVSTPPSGSRCLIFFADARKLIGFQLHPLTVFHQ